MAGDSPVPSRIETQALTFSYGSNVIVNDVSISIAPGTFVGIVGPNGCGKTTLARLIAGKLRPALGAVLVDGCAEGADFQSQNPGTNSVWLVGADPEMQFITGTALDEVAFALQVRGIPAEEIIQTCKETLQAVGLREVEDVHPFFLSTGEQFRLLLAVALVQRPRCLLLDEVTSMMDSHTRQQILQLLGEHRLQMGMAVVLFTHRLEDLRHADAIVVMHDGQVVFDGAVDKAFAAACLHPQWRVEVPLTYKLERSLPEAWRPLLAEATAN